MSSIFDDKANGQDSFECNGDNFLLNHLTPKHLADLRASGLSDQQISRCGFYSLQTAAGVQRILNWKRYDGALGDCLAIPFFDVDGKPTGYTRLKPDNPRKDKKTGKPIKYESPKGVSNRAYFPPRTRAVLKDSTAPLVISEGEKKATKADQEGLVCIGLVGVYGWQKKRAEGKDGNPIGEREFIDDLANITWQGRLVYLCFDSDAVTNPNVRWAEWHLAEALARKGADVKIIRLPAGDTGTDGKPCKVGLDDFLVARGPEAYRELMAGAVDPTTPERELQPIEAVDDPSRLAQLYRDSNCQHRDGLTLRFWQEQWWKWIGNRFCLIPDAELTADLCKYVRAEFVRVHLEELRRWEELPESERGPRPTVRKITKGLITNVEMALASLTVLAGDVVSPAWWDGKEWRSRNLIALSNGLLDLDALFADKDDALLTHTPRWFSPVCLPYPFEADAECPRWLAFLDRNLEGDAERIGLLQEWFGLSCIPETSRQKFLVLEGDGSNGKSVVCAALEAMLGTENCSHVPLEVFGERFQLHSSIGKLANVASEVGELDKAAEGFLKSFTSGDPMQFDRKHKPPIQATPTARLVLSTNNRPRFSDRSGGLWRRMILMPFRVAIAEDDPTRVFGMDKPDWWVASSELPGMFVWALAGLDRLRLQNRFTRSEVCDQALGEYRTENNPARMFLLDSCREAPEGQAPCGELYKAYRDWCNANGYSPLADRSFGKEVRRVFTKAERRQIGPRESRRPTYYCGIDFIGIGE
jgi:P4 family phage/plasmid primase-like protien